MIAPPVGDSFSPSSAGAHEPPCYWAPLPQVGEEALRSEPPVPRRHPPSVLPPEFVTLPQAGPFQAPAHWARASLGSTNQDQTLQLDRAYKAHHQY